MSDCKDSQEGLPVQAGPASKGHAGLISAFRLPNAIKKSLPPSLIAGMYGIRLRLLSRGLRRNRVYTQPLEQKQAGASMSIVIAIHDAPAVLRRCLLSLERYATESEVILVDDASKLAETIDLIREFSTRNGWRAIRHEKARGHSAACGAGASFASRPYICLLNSDTVATPWCWLPIAETFENNAAIGVAGPCTSASGNEQAVDAARLCRFDWNDNQISGFAEKLATSPPQPVIVDLPWADGFAFFIRRSLWQELGGFDCNLPDYGNEIDLCKRVTKFGYRVVWIRSSYIHHLQHQSYGNEIGGQGISSRIVAALQYIHQRHSQPAAVTPPPLR
jgi:GT2 family glycosyltransferase